MGGQSGKATRPVYLSAAVPFEPQLLLQPSNLATKCYPFRQDGSVSSTAEDSFRLVHLYSNPTSPFPSLDRGTLQNHRSTSPSLFLSCTDASIVNVEMDLMNVCVVGGNAVSAFLSWRLQATNACDVTLVWKSGFDAVYQYGISFKYVWKSRPLFPCANADNPICRSTSFGNERFKPRHGTFFEILLNHWDKY